MKKYIWAAVLSLLTIAQAEAQKDDKWKVENPKGNWNFKEVSLDTDDLRYTRYELGAVPSSCSSPR